MITKELRDYVWKKVPSRHLEDLIGIADRIEGRYEECEGFARRLEDAAGNREYVTLFGVDYFPLPKDADGETICLADKMQVPKDRTRYVEAVGPNYFVAWCPEQSRYLIYEGRTAKHLPWDSWERIIRDAMRAAREDKLPFPEAGSEGKALVERCRKLAGEE